MSLCGAPTVSCGAPRPAEVPTIKARFSKLLPDGTFTDVYNFEGGLNGGVPYAGLTQDPEGNFYSTVGGGPMAAFKGLRHDFQFTPQ